MTDFCWVQEGKRELSGSSDFTKTKVLFKTYLTKLDQRKYFFARTISFLNDLNIYGTLKERCEFLLFPFPTFEFVNSNHVVQEVKFVIRASFKKYYSRVSVRFPSPRLVAIATSPSRVIITP